MIFDLSRATYAASVAYTAIAFNDKKVLWWWWLIFFMEIPKMVMVKENRKE